MFQGRGRSRENKSRTCGGHIQPSIQYFLLLDPPRGFIQSDLELGDACLLIDGKAHLARKVLKCHTFKKVHFDRGEDMQCLAAV